MKQRFYKIVVILHLFVVILSKRRVRQCILGVKPLKKTIIFTFSCIYSKLFPIINRYASENDSNAIKK